MMRNDSTSKTSKKIVSTESEVDICVSSQSAKFSSDTIDHTQGMDPDSPWEENPHSDHVPEAEWTKITSEFTNVGCNPILLHTCSFLIIVWVPRGHHCRKRSVFASRI